jgi:hypothetical protein
MKILCREKAFLEWKEGKKQDEARKRDWECSLVVHCLVLNLISSITRIKGGEKRSYSGRRRLTPIILPIPGRQRSGGSRFEASQANSSRDPVLKKLITKKGLVECLKV